MKTKEKFKTYFTGFGIGLILVGLIFYAKWKYTQNNPQHQPQQPHQQQHQQQTP